MTEQIPDPRPLYAGALTWVRGLLDAVRPDQLDGPTPCPEFDVRTLAGHLVGTVGRARVIGEGGDPREAPFVVDGIADDGFAAAYGEEIDKVLAVWRDDAILDRMATVPWGTLPGRAALAGYVNETLVHGWDLAVSTGQPAEAPREIAEAALAAAPRVLPAEPRGGHVPFAAVVEPAPDAGPTERLANWCGRPRR
ncbi:TIGR03086 family metal-binding protein [Pseudonocardia sp. CA-107938]|uniref:TIGR03086 family metal-binding protein n=1 Tax=Pseudonocardia sp. CA-107938 TaxID=3240021 RepID=UPI003D8FACB4